MGLGRLLKAAFGSKKALEDHTNDLFKGELNKSGLSVEQKQRAMNDTSNAVERFAELGGKKLSTAAKVGGGALAASGAVLLAPLVGGAVAGSSVAGTGAAGAKVAKKTGTDFLKDLGGISSIKNPLEKSTYKESPIAISEGSTSNPLDIIDKAILFGSKAQEGIQKGKDLLSDLGGSVDEFLNGKRTTVEASAGGGMGFGTLGIVAGLLLLVWAVSQKQNGR